MARATVDITLTPQEHRLLRSALEEARMTAAAEQTNPHTTELLHQKLVEREADLRKLLEKL